MMIGKKLLVDARDVVVALQVGDAGHLDEIFEAGGVLGQERQMIAGLAASFCLALAALSRRDVCFVADDRIDPGLSAGEVKFDRPEQIAVVRDGAGVHAQLLDVSHQLRYAASAIEQAVVTVAVQMNERTLRHLWILVPVWKPFLKES